MSHTKLIAGVFSGAQAEASAAAAASAIRQHVGQVHAQNVALLTRDASGALQIDESAERDEIRRDTTAGAVLGWLVGFANTLAGGPLGPAEGGPLGQAMGQQISAGRDVGFAQAFLRQLGATLAQGDAALLAAIPAREAEATLELLAQHQAVAHAYDLDPRLLASG